MDNLPGTSSSVSGSQRDASVFNPNGNDQLSASLLSSNSLASSTGSTDGTDTSNSDSSSGNGGSNTPGTTIQGYQRLPAGVQYMTGGSSANGVTSTNPYGASSSNPYGSTSSNPYGVSSSNRYYSTGNSASTRPSLTDTIGRNLVTIGSKFLSDLVNGDPNKITAGSNPYNSPTYLAQYRQQQAQIAAASARNAQLLSAARSSAAAYNAAQNGNPLVNSARSTTSAPIGSQTLTPELIREAVRRSSLMSDYYKHHPSAGIIGTGLRRMQSTTTTTAKSTPTPVPGQVIDSTTGDSATVSESDPTGSAETGGSGGQVVNTTTYPDGSGTTLSGASSTTNLGTTSVTDTTLTGTSSTTCETTALNAGNCNPNFRNKICDLGCTNNEQAAVSALCQRNDCPVGVSLSSPKTSLPD